MKARTVALAAEELRRAGFKCYVCTVTKRRRIYFHNADLTRTPAGQLAAIIRVRSGWFVGMPYGQESIPNPRDPRLFTLRRTAAPLAELQGPFQNWRTAMACYRITNGVQ